MNTCLLKELPAPFIFLRKNKLSRVEDGSNHATERPESSYLKRKTIPNMMLCLEAFELDTKQIGLLYQCGREGRTMAALKSHEPGSND